VKTVFDEVNGVTIHPAIVDAVDWLQARPGGRFEDWGCGSAQSWVKPLVTKMQYIGVDRRPGVDVEVVTDLVHRLSDADSIFIHHVLAAAGAYWPMILDNALRSFRMRMAVVESEVTIGGGLIEPIFRMHARPYEVVRIDDRSIYKIER
jgi:hypothetical protein